MARSLPIALLALAATFVNAQDVTTYEGLLRRQAHERATIARVKSRTVARQDLETLLRRHQDELLRYAEAAPVSSAKLAREKALERRVDLARLLLERDPKTETGLAGEVDDRMFALVVERACSESQEKLASVLDARARAKKITLKGPGVVLLDGADARALGVRWGKVELIVDRGGAVRGVDLVGDERQNLLGEVTKEVAK
jgi:hypothetical protein